MNFNNEDGIKVLKENEKIFIYLQIRNDEFFTIYYKYYDLFSQLFYTFSNIFYLWNYIYNNPDEKNSVQKIKKRLTEYKISAKINNILRVCLSKFCERHRVKWILPTLE